MHVLLTLNLLGLGGPQNPLTLDTGRTAAILNGLYDGLTWWLVVLKDIFNAADYQLYTHNASGDYFIGLIIGFILSLMILGWLLSLVRGLFPSRRVYRRL